MLGLESSVLTSLLAVLTFGKFINLTVPRFSCLPKWDTIATLTKSAIRNDHLEASSKYRAAYKFFIMIKVLIVIIAASNFIEFLILLQILEFCFIAFYFLFFFTFYFEIISNLQKRSKNSQKNSN